MLQHDGDPSRCAVLLPGVRYFSQAPLLWFAREAAQARGWSVVEVDERAPDGEDPFEWMLGQAERALAATSAELTVVVGKSLGSVAATMVRRAGRMADAATHPARHRRRPGGGPLPSAAGGQPRRPQLGRGAALPDNPLLEVLELPGLDHSLQVSGDPLASLDVLRDRDSSALGAFFDRVSDTP